MPNEALEIYTLESCGRSDTGLVRKTNEDAWAREANCNLFVLADGIGGRNAGEIASQCAVNRLCQLIAHHEKHKGVASAPEDPLKVLKDHILKTNRSILDMARTNEFLRGMGTTLCCLWIKHTHGYYAHLGDSRLYILRDQHLQILTNDHRPQKPENSNSTNIITKAIGISEHADPSLGSIELKTNDTLLLCSDGLSNMVKDHEIESILKKAPDCGQGADQLIKMANRRGGLDNITVLLIKVKEYA